MRAALLADIHGNAPALRAVLEDALACAVDAFWFLGDILGYGPLPVACINLLDEISPTVWLAGNHDLAGFRLWDGADENEPFVRRMAPGLDERRVLGWHAEQMRVGLSGQRARGIGGAPLWAEAIPGVYAAHGAILSTDPNGPENTSGTNSYVRPDSAGAVLSRNNLATISEQAGALPWLLVVGHTHRPAFCQIGWAPAQRPLWQELLERDVNSNPIAIQRPAQGLTLLCPGSVGYPRESRGDWRAAYAILDSDARQVWFRRVGYNVREAWAAMVQPPRPLNDAVSNWVEGVQGNYAVHQAPHPMEDDEDEAAEFRVS
jgi:predicted phosphodiesterase